MFPADLVTFTEKFLSCKLHFFFQRMCPSSHSFQVINKDVSVQDISLGYVYKA